MILNTSNKKDHKILNHKSLEKGSYSVWLKWTPTDHIYFLYMHTLFFWGMSTECQTAAVIAAEQHQGLIGSAGVEYPRQ